MPQTKKETATQLLSPTIFEKGAAKLDIYSIPKQAAKLLTSTAVDANMGSEAKTNASVGMNTKTATDTVSAISGGSAAMTTDTSINAPDGIQNENLNDSHTHTHTHTHTRTVVLCDDEAMEYLRHCQGQFVALISSELASCDSAVHFQNNKKKSKNKKKGGKGKCKGNDNGDDDVNDGDNDNDNDNNDSHDDNAIRTIMPHHVQSALERLEFHDLLTEVQLVTKNAAVTVKTNTKPKGTKTTATATEAKTTTAMSTKARRAAAIRKNKKQKKMLMDESAMADLMKEQERLFAASASKAREEQERKKASHQQRK